jgi:hypothetical protein
MTGWSHRLHAFAALLVLAAGCSAPPTDNASDEGARAGTSQPPSRHETVIAIPASLRGLPTGRAGADGEPVVVACTTCHTGEARPLPDAGSPPGGPHAGLSLRHGSNTCGSCHDPERRELLRLADGTRIELVEALRLCGQCHGSQLRDYQRGAHGGMSGHWDLTAGPRTRNHCVHCHDPHAPKYPGLLPAPPPRDRFFGNKGGEHG